MYLKLTRGHSVIERLFSLVLRPTTRWWTQLATYCLSKLNAYASLIPTTMAHSRTAAARSRLDVLPLELISIIFKNLDNDLVAHVTFSTLRPDIYDFCYKGLAPEFWKNILRASGISTPTQSTLDPEEWSSSTEGPNKYEELARRCVAHAEDCSHPKCGMARIRSNGESLCIWFHTSDQKLIYRICTLVRIIEEFVKTRLERDPSCMRTWDAEDDDDEKGLHGLLQMNPVWDHIMLKRHNWHYLRPPSMWRLLSFLRPDTSASTDDDDTLQYGDELYEHPILWMSFASFPPVTKFSILWGVPSPIKPHNRNGVIVADVLQQVLIAPEYVLPDIDLFLTYLSCATLIVKSRRSRYHMSCSEFVEFIERSELENELEEQKHPIVPRSWTLSGIFNALGNFKLLDWLTVV